MELIEIIKIAAIAALVVFIFSTIFLVSSFRSLTIIFKDSFKSIDNFKDDLSDTLNKLENDVSDLNDNIEKTLGNIDNTVKIVYDTVKDFSEMKDRIIVSLDNVDNLAVSLHENSKDAGEFKIKLDETVGNINNLALQLSQTTDIIGRESLNLLRAFKPFFNALNFVEQKLITPYSSISTYFNAAYKAVTTFAKHYSEHKDFRNIKGKMDDIHIYTKDVNEQIHGPSFYDENDIEFATHVENKRKEPRASDDFNVVEAENDYLNSYGNSIGDLDHDGLLNNTYLNTEELLRQAEIEIENDNEKSPEEKAELKLQISDLREDILKSVKEFKDELNK
jgi:hypothetical protein